MVVGDGTLAEGRVVDRRSGETALGVFGDRTLGIVGPDGPVEIRFRRLILATGSWERLPPIAGTTCRASSGRRWPPACRPARASRCGARVRRLTIAK